MDQIDELVDLGLLECDALIVLDWHSNKIREERINAGGEVITRLLSYLLTKRHKDNPLRIRVMGLAFGWGLEGLTGYETAEACARGEGCSSMAISRAAKEAREALSI